MLNLYSVKVITDSSSKEMFMTAESTKEAVNKVKKFYSENYSDGGYGKRIIGTISKLISEDL